MLNWYNLAVTQLQAFVPRQRQIHVCAHRHNQLLLHFRRIETLVARVQRARHLLVLANRPCPIPLLGVRVRLSVAHILGEYVFEIIVGVFVFAGNVDELLVLFVGGGELFALELFGKRIIYAVL